MADRTPVQEQRIIDTEVRLTDSAICLSDCRETLERTDDVVRDARHAGLIENEHRAARIQRLLALRT
jgi:hypothetical protein